MLDRDLDESEEQIQVAMRTHLRSIDVLIDTQDARLLSLEAEFTAGHRTVSVDFGTERERILGRLSRDRKELQDVVSSVDAAEMQVALETKQVLWGLALCSGMEHTGRALRSMNRSAK